MDLVPVTVGLPVRRGITMLSSTMPSLLRSPNRSRLELGGDNFWNWSLLVSTLASLLAVPELMLAQALLLQLSGVREVTIMARVGGITARGGAKHAQLKV